MKNYKYFLIALLVALMPCFGRAMNYNASICGQDGQPLPETDVEVVFSIVDKGGNSVFVESHTAKTDKRGMISLEVGHGNTQNGNFNDIDWTDNDLKAEINYRLPDGSSKSETLPLATVPSAYHANETSALISRTDNGTYSLAVDDNGRLSATLKTNDIIPIPEGYTRMIFHDEFDVDGMLNPEFWGYEEGYVRGGEMQYYTVGRSENAYVKDGLLHIVTLNDNWTDENGETHAVTSASVMTKDKVKFTYGRVDIRAKLPICLGSWPALWLMPNDDVYGYWPNSGEIDIMEHVGFNPYNIYFTAHCAEQNGSDNKYHGSTSLPTCTTEFHVYSLEWSENRLDWYIDGKRKWTVVKNSNTWRGWPYNKDFYLIMNTAFGGSWGGQKGVDLEALPITFEIDYVRVFQ